MQVCLEHDDEGNVSKRKAGIMTIVKKSGVIRNSDEIRIELPPLPHIKLEKI